MCHAFWLKLFGVPECVYPSRATAVRRIRPGTMGECPTCSSDPKASRRYTGYLFGSSRRSTLTRRSTPELTRTVPDANGNQMNLSSQFQVRTFTRTDPEYWVGTTFGGTIDSLPVTSDEWAAAEKASRRFPNPSPQRTALCAALDGTAHHLAP